MPRQNFVTYIHPTKNSLLEVFEKFAEQQEVIKIRQNVNCSGRCRSLIFFSDVRSLKRVHLFSYLALKKLSRD